MATVRRNLLPFIDPLLSLILSFQTCRQRGIIALSEREHSAAVSAPAGPQRSSRRLSLRRRGSECRVLSGGKFLYIFLCPDAACVLVIAAGSISEHNRAHRSRTRRRVIRVFPIGTRGLYLHRVAKYPGAQCSRQLLLLLHPRPVPADSFLPATSAAAAAHAK